MYRAPNGPRLRSERNCLGAGARLSVIMGTGQSRLDDTNGARLRHTPNSLDRGQGLNKLSPKEARIRRLPLIPGFLTAGFFRIISPGWPSD